MIRIEGGPVALASLFLISVALAAAFAAAIDWGRRWLRHRTIPVTGELSRLITETRRILDDNEKGIFTFMDRFGRDLYEEAGSEMAHVTLHDLRNHVECAVYDLVQGCDCGECSGVSDGMFFWIEAEFREGRLWLHGTVRKELTRVDAGAAPAVEQAKLSANVTMVCSRCRERQVVTSIDHLGEGKQPVCAACIAGGSRGS